MITMSPGALALSETLLGANREANRLDGKMAYQTHAYGKIQEALIETVACGISDAQPVHFGQSRTIARRLVDEALDNGENIAYQIALLADGVITV